MASQLRHNRLHHYDFLRLFLVLLALTSHFITSQRWQNIISNDTLISIKIFSRMAMPCLLIIFGFMFEYVYAKRWALVGSKIILKRMAGRTILCYLAFISLSFFGFLAGHNNLTAAIKSLVLIAPAQHANLFKYYALLIPMIYIIMWIRFKFSFIHSMILVISLITIVEILDGFTIYSPPAFQHIIALLFGIGNSWGPSLVHALILVTFGMFVADVISNRKFSLPASFLIIFVTASLILISNELYLIGYEQVIFRIITITEYRFHNSYIYFAYGILSFLVLWQIFQMITKLFSVNLKNKISLYGGNTFTIFYYGNFIILLTPDLSRTLSLSESVLLLFLTLVASILSVNLIEYLDSRFKLFNSFNVFIKTFLSPIYKLTEKTFRYRGETIPN